MRKFLASLAGALVLLAAQHARADSYGPATAPALRERAVLPNAPLMATGLLVFTGAYVPAIVWAASSHTSDDRYLYVPGAGPWISVAKRDCPFEGTACYTNDVDRGLMIAMGIGQAAGLALFVASFLLPEKHLVQTAHVYVAPSIGKNSAGVGIGGRF